MTKTKLRLKWTAHPHWRDTIVATVGPFELLVSTESSKESGSAHASYATVFAYSEQQESLRREVDDEGQGERWLAPSFTSQLKAQLWCENTLLALGRDILAAFGEAGE